MLQKTYLEQEAIPELRPILTELGKELKNKWKKSDEDVEACPDELLPPFVELIWKVVDLCQVN